MAREEISREHQSMAFPPRAAVRPDGSVQHADPASHENPHSPAPPLPPEPRVDLTPRSAEGHPRNSPAIQRIVNRHRQSAQSNDARTGAVAETRAVAPSVDIEPRTPVAGVNVLDENALRQVLNDVETNNPKSTQTAIKDPRYTTVNLLSNGKLHGVPVTVAVRKFQAVHRAKLNRAATEEQLQPLVEAISATLGDGVSAFDLTFTDLFQLLHWHRLNSWTSIPYVQVDYCKNPDHVEAVLKGTKPRSSLEIKTTLRDTTLEYKFLEPNKEDVEKWSAAVADALPEGSYITHSTVQDICDINHYLSELRERAQTSDADRPKTDKDIQEELAHIDELAWLADRAAYIGPKTLSVADRVKIVSEMDLNHADALEQLIKIYNDYGISENVQVTCTDCGAQMTTAVRLSAESFLS